MKTYKKSDNLPFMINKIEILATLGESKVTVHVMNTYAE
jgi:hypothetical protein